MEWVITQNQIVKLKENKIKVELDLSNYATKSEVKNATVVNTPDFAKKSDLTSLQLAADELDINELKTDLSKLSNAVDNDVVKKNKKSLSKLNLEKNIEDVDKIIPDTSRFIETK